MDHETLQLSRRCEESARQQAALTREVVRFGPFEGLIDRADALIWLNYAVPVASLDDLEAARAALGDLARHFEQRERRPRFEFHAGPWPTLPALLEQANFQLQARHPLLVCTAADLRLHVAPTVTTERVGADAPDADLAAFIRIQASGFGDSVGQLGPERLGYLREEIASGNAIYGLARIAGEPAGVAMLGCVDEVGEIVGVATYEAYRRRGVAAMLCSQLASDFFASGGAIAWLSAGDEIAQATYVKIGFQLIDERLNYMA